MVSIEFDGEQYAMLYRNQAMGEGVHFLTPPELPLQIGMLVHQANKQIRPHVHQHHDKLTHSTFEVLFLIEGRIEIQFYSKVGKIRGVQTMGPGDVILLMFGGHGVKILETCRILEVKQGPYFGVETEKLYLPEEEDDSGL
jgi:hypothetical protein